jgi:hypothetical protein
MLPRDAPPLLARLAIVVEVFAARLALRILEQITDLAADLQSALRHELGTIVAS